ncbi:MAG: dihydrolipoyl dehydrogenase [Candidatus Marinimicrobia bacterium]|nr:dihydrolipoyl dehydrogenase [Candidatus Neomarinimicrobiota bacterium]
MKDTQFDLIVIGGGPGGYTAAIRAAQLGIKTAVVERENLGGVCLNWGCIPTKALLRSAEVLDLMQHSSEFGLKAENISFDLEAVVQRSRDVANQLNSGVRHLMKKNKITVFDGQGKLIGRGKIQVTKDEKSVSELRAKHIILATGARAREIPGMGADGNLVWTYRHAMVPKLIPKTLLVIGSGAIGIEFASFFQSLGSKVTVVEILDRIVPVEDAEVSAFVQKQFEQQGMVIKTKSVVSALKKEKNSVIATIKKGDKTENITFERVISAVGIVGNFEELGLSNTKVKVEKTHVVIDSYCQTDEPGVYAIGDLCGPPWLAHKAGHEAVICVEKIAGLKPHPLDIEGIPGCTYSHPQIASIGLTEQIAKDKGYKIRIGRYPFMANGKAIALGEKNGFVKTVFDEKTGQLLGAHMVGAEVTEMIQGYAIAKSLETTEKELMQTVFPHPTLSEMMHESVLDAYGRAINF